MRFGKATILAFGIGFLPAASAHAWKPITHAVLAQQVVDELIANDGYLNIEVVDLKNGKVLTDKPRKYKAVPELYQAVKNHPAIFYNGVVGPDSYPDIATGQSIVHPPKADGMGTDHWWKALWNKTHNGPHAKPQNLAFMMGMYAHSAGDMFAHSFVNAYTGGPFAYNWNGLQHNVLEGYLLERTPSLALHQGKNVYGLVANEGMTDDLAKFIRNALDPYEGLSHYVGTGHKKSLPWHFAKLRKGLLDNVATLHAQEQAWHTEYLNRQKLYDDVAGPQKNGEGTLDYIARKAKILTRGDDLIAAKFMDKTMGVAWRQVVIPYMKAWAADIETGLVEWAKVSHKVGMAMMFHDPAAKKLTAEDKLNVIAKALGQYWIGTGKNDAYGLKMIGVPNIIANAIGTAKSNMSKAEKAVMKLISTLLSPLQKLAEWPKAILAQALGPFKWLADGIKDGGKAFGKYLLKEATGIDYDLWAGYESDPASALDKLFKDKKQPNARLENGQTLTVAHLNEVMGLGNVGTKGNKRFAYRDFAPAFNTVNMIKLSFLGVDETNHLVQSLGGAQTLTAKNAMLGGWLDSMDAGNQWLHGDQLVYARQCSVFRQLFRQQAVPTGSAHEPADPCMNASANRGSLPEPAKTGQRPPSAVLIAFGQSEIELESGKPHRFNLNGQFKSFSLSLDAGDEPTGAITGKDAKGFTYTPPQTTEKEFEVNFIAADETNYDTMMKVHVVPAFHISPAVPFVEGGQSEAFEVVTPRRVKFRVAKGRGSFGNETVLAKLRQEQSALKTAKPAGLLQFAIIAANGHETKRLDEAIKKEEATYYAPADAKEGEQVTVEAAIGRGNKEGDRTVSLSFVLRAKNALREAELAQLVESRGATVDPAAPATPGGTPTVSCGTADTESSAPLKLFWSGRRQDNFVTATPRGASDAVAAGYDLIRTEGRLLTTPCPGTIPLKTYWGQRRGDNMATSTAAGEGAAKGAGYSFVRIEGYVYEKQEPNTIPLKLYWNAERGDNMTLASPEAEADAKAAGYTLVRIEGYILAPSTSGGR